MGLLELIGLRQEFRVRIYKINGGCTEAWTFLLQEIREKPSLREYDLVRVEYKDQSLKGGEKGYVGISFYHKR